MAIRFKAIEKISFEEKLADTRRFVSYVSTSDLYNLSTDTVKKPGDTDAIFGARKYRSLAMADNLGDEYPGRAAARYSRLPDNVLMDVHERSEYLVTKVRQSMLSWVFGGGAGIMVAGVSLVTGFNQVSYGLLACSGTVIAAGAFSTRDANRSLTVIKQAVDDHLDRLSPK